MTIDTRQKAPTWVPPMEFDPARAVPVPMDEPTPTLEGEVLPPPKPKGVGAAGLFVFALVALVLAGIGFDTAALLLQAWEVSPWLAGGLGALAALAVGSLGALGFKELRAFARLKKVDGLRQRAETLRAAGGHGRAKPLVKQVQGLYAGRPLLAPARDGLARSLTDAHDDREALDLTERLLLDPIDRSAYRLVLAASHDVAVGTALSPAALLDAAIVLWRNAKLVREIASLYAARPGRIGSLVLMRRMLANIGIAGVAESGDSLAVEALGGTLAAALSARFGQGVINGLLTARIGLAAMHLCRPLPFAPERRPRLAEIRKELLTLPKQVG